MLITLSRRTTICQSVAEVYMSGVVPLGAVSHRFNYNIFKINVPNINPPGGTFSCRLSLKFAVSTGDFKYKQACEEKLPRLFKS